MVWWGGIEGGGRKWTRGKGGVFAHFSSSFSNDFYSFFLSFFLSLLSSSLVVVMVKFLR